jgi:aspartate ammonia-lyase
MIYYGEETARAAENFDIGYKKNNLKLVHALATVKKAAALTYEKLGINASLYHKMALVCSRAENGEFDDSFVLDALQGGAGTSLNMNMNEVIANVLQAQTDIPVHPIDDVNRSQSTNDVYPTALRIACIKELRNLSAACADLQQSLQKRENEFENIKKLGRTELSDAVGITLGGEFGSYAQAISRDRWRLYKAEERLRYVNIGSTAVGKYDNASRAYRFEIIEQLRELTGIGLASAEYPMDITQNNDVFAEVSGLLKSLAVNLMKIAGDIRLMASGPCGGLGEIKLPKMQKGSSIMPGKVNPVIPEAVMQCAMRAVANDAAVTEAASRGEFELNAFLPLIADSMLETICILESAVKLLNKKCILILEPVEQRCSDILENSYYFAASFVPSLGYDTVAKVIESGLTPSEAKIKLEKMKSEKDE